MFLEIPLAEEVTMDMLGSNAALVQTSLGSGSLTDLGGLESLVSNSSDHLSHQSHHSLHHSSQHTHHLHSGDLTIIIEKIEIVS